MLAVVALRMTHRRVIRLLVPPLAAVLVLAIGVSRLYLGVHWLTDVLVGWLLGSAWLIICVSALVVRRPNSAPAVAPLP